MKVLVTGSSGLIGSEAVLWFDRQGQTVLGVDGAFNLLEATP